MKTVLIGAGIIVAALTALAAPGLNQLTLQAAALRGTNTITLSGEVVRLMDDDFMLNDGTGPIEVEAETAAIREAALAAGTTVTVTGYYDEDEFEAVTLTPSGGETITVFDD